jgi:soluble lytic murein transglycosylase-like protein
MRAFKYAIIGAILGITMIACFGFNRANHKNPEQGVIVLHKKIKSNDPPCLRMYYYIRQYADSFHIPINYAYGIAYNETGYNGPFDWDYNHRRVSRAGAVGPMQIKPSTARLVNGTKVKAANLKNNIEYNVCTSMKLLRLLHDKYNNWKLVFGCYNTGRPIVNGYALRVFHFQPSWISQEMYENETAEETAENEVVR